MNVSISFGARSRKSGLFLSPYSLINIESPISLALTNRLGKKIILLFFLQHSEKKTSLPSRPVFFLQVYTDSPNVQKHPIYRLSVELIDTLSICTSFSWKVCITGYGGKIRLAASNCLFIIFHARRKSREKPPFLHILKVGNDPGQLLKHAFKSLPGVQIHIVSTHQQIIRADIEINCKRNQQIQRRTS